jgi:Domain of unknown function (DUF4862)
MTIDLRHFHVSAYATSPSFHRWDAALESRYFAALAAERRVAGIEHPFFDDGGAHYPLDWLVDHLPAHWTLTLTALPGLMRQARTEPRFGLASAHEPSRVAAVRMIERAREFVAALHTRLGRPVVRAIHLQSSPANVAGVPRGHVAALEASLREVLGWQWGDARLLLEHCDSVVEGHAPEKGFLGLEDEIALAQRLHIGLLVNWARSAIETRSVEGPVAHLARAREAGVLQGLAFSGCAAQACADYGTWRDTHMPAAPVVASPFLRADSLLGADEIRAALAQAASVEGAVMLGIKVLDPVPGPDLDRKLRLNIDTLAAVVAAATMALPGAAASVRAYELPGVSP